MQVALPPERNENGVGTRAADAGAMMAMNGADGEQAQFNPDENSELERENSISSSSSSLSSSKDAPSEEGDFIQLDAIELHRSIEGNSGIPNGNPSKLPPGVGGDGSHLASEVDARNGGEMAGPNNNSNITSPVRTAGSPADSGLLGAKQPPPVQVMTGRSEAPDPYRIPSTVFERSKSSTPMEWSVASNESLFSIHVGNSSFSRDHVFLMGRSGDLANFSYSPPEPLLPVSTLADSHHVRDLEPVGENDHLEQAVATEAANAEAMKDVLRAAADERDNGAGTEKPRAADSILHHSASTSRRSDASGTSINSFAFPILTEGRSVSMKVEPEQQQQQLQTQQQPKAAEQQETTIEVAPAAAQDKWFPCFSCSFCC